MSEELKYWVALSLMRGAWRALRQCYDKPHLIEPDCLFERAAFQTGTLKETLLEEAQRLIERAHATGIGLIGFGSASYPELLRHIYEPPFVLYAQGRVELLHAPSVAVVGTRRASGYGRQMAERFGGELSSAGVTVVSGMARGCDTWAHRGALACGGNTIAVLGTGIDVVYPRENKSLYRDIADKGLLLTEFCFGTPPLAKNFPIRNRIISGLTAGVVVIEAPIRSGAMMTARLSLESGREVFALPGRADSKRSSGTHRLIKEGAMLVEDAQDVLTALFPGLNTSPRQQAEPEPAAMAEDEERLLYNLLEEEPLHIDSIQQKSGLPSDRLAYLLLTMELKGFVEQRPGKFFVKRTV